MSEVCASFEVLLYVQSLRRVYITSDEGFITSVRDWTGDFAVAMRISMDIAGSPTRNTETSQRQTINRRSESWISTSCPRTRKRGRERAGSVRVAITSSTTSGNITVFVKVDY